MEGYMPLPEGVWTVNVNGTRGELHLSAPTAGGNIQGTLFNVQLRGLWNEISQTVNFVTEREFTQLVGGGVTLTGFAPRMFRAHLFSTPPATQTGQDILWTLAGTVTDAVGESANGVSGNSRRNEFGWFAQITQVV
jgi:hypothetical protein